MRFAQDGFKVLLATSGSYAVDIVGRFGRRVHAVVSDFESPGMSDIELIAEIGRTNPRVPVLLVSDSAVESNPNIGAVLRDTLRLSARPLTRNSVTSTVNELCRAAVRCQKANGECSIEG